MLLRVGWVDPGRLVFGGWLAGSVAFNEGGVAVCASTDIRASSGSNNVTHRPEVVMRRLDLTPLSAER
jgi:hypothetical protein